MIKTIELLDFAEPEHLNIGFSESPASLRAGSTLRPELNGQRLKLPGNDGIYLIDRGARRLIPDLPTFFGLFRDNEVILDPQLYDIPLGPTMTSGACLAMANNGIPNIYLVDNGMKRWIISPPIFDKYHFDIARVATLPAAVIAGIRDGDKIAS